MEELCPLTNDDIVKMIEETWTPLKDAQYTAILNSNIKRISTWSWEYADLVLGHRGEPSNP